MIPGKRLLSAPLHLWATLGAMPLPATVGFLVAFNLVASVGASTGFALSGQAGGVRAFVLWQIAGGLCGLCGQLSFAGLVHFSSVRVANSIGIGLAFAMSQLIGAHWFFDETFSRLQWAGTILVVAGVLCIASGK